MKPTYFALSPGFPFSQSEKHHFGTLKWTFEGVRQVVLTREEALLQFFRSRHPGQPPSFTDLWRFFKEMTGDLMQAYMSNHGAGCTFAVTVAKQEMLYTPSTYVVCERGQAMHCAGFRLASVRTCEHQELSKVFGHMEGKQGASSGKKPSVLSLEVTVTA